MVPGTSFVVLLPTVFCLLVKTTATPNFWSINPEVLPYHVVINSKFVCTGILISDQYILCPAYCLDGSTWGARIFLGYSADAYFQSDILWQKDTEAVSSEDFIIHEKYIKISKNVYLNNIALIKLPHKISIRKNIRPGQLMTLENFQQIGERMVNVSGWFTHTVSNLSVTEVRLLNQDYCSYLYKSDFLKDQQLCAEWHENNRLNLSGNPISINNKILGFVTKSPCTFNNTRCSKHDIFLAIPTFLNWISDKTGVSKEKLTGTIDTNGKLDELRELIEDIKIENADDRDRLDRVEYTLDQILGALKAIKRNVEQSCIVWNNN